MGHLSRGVQIYHAEFNFITWSSNLSCRIQIYHVEFKFITRNSNLLKGQIKKRDVVVSDKFYLSNGLFQIRCFFKVDS